MFIGRTKSATVLANSGYGNLMNTGKRYHLRHCLAPVLNHQSCILHASLLCIPLTILRLGQDLRVYHPSPDPP